MVHNRWTLLAPARALALLAFVQIPQSVHGGEHPSLLIRGADVTRLRHVCGVGVQGSTERFGPYAARAAEFRSLRVQLLRSAHPSATTRPEEPDATAPADDARLPGEIAAGALLHLIDAADAGEATRMAAINSALRAPPLLDDDGIELVLALDWCWSALDRDARREFVLAVRERGRPLTAADSPLEHRTFREKLLTLAVALAIDGEDEPGGSWGEFRERMIAAAKAYFENTFPTFVEWRGLSPTGTGAATWEENDAALAVELCRRMGRENAWEAQRDGVARWCEHRILASVSAGDLRVPLLHDDWGAAYDPAYLRERLPIPSTAHLIAARTREPSAASVADEVERGCRRGTNTPPLTCCISSILFDLRGVPRLNLDALPPIHNLHGAIVLRGRPTNAPAADGITIWIDAAQPLLGKRQHFDAGHFLIHRGGFLAVAGGDDIAGEATVEKGGSQRLGSRSDAFDFDQYFMGTIAHNCVIFNDPARAGYWRGKRYIPISGQTPREESSYDSAKPLDTQTRLMGRLLACGSVEGDSYVALDLAPAYDSRSVAKYTREFVFVLGRALIVIDRARPAHTRVDPIVLVQIPTRPALDGKALPLADKIRGKTEDAGVWECKGTHSIRTQHGDGALWIVNAWPADSRLRIAGGPAQPIRRQTIDGAATTYRGGEADGFERLLSPANRPDAANAWYRLGPRAPEVAHLPHWGRVEIEAGKELGQYLFVTVLVTGRSSEANVPAVTMRRGADGLELSLTFAPESATLRFAGGEKLGGRVEYGDGQRAAWQLPEDIAPDAALATK